MPEMHPTYGEEVRPRRRLARGAEDPITKAASNAAGVDLDFCIRLRRNMRRYVTIGPEYDPGPAGDFHTTYGTGLLEYRMYGSVNKSEMSGTAIRYRQRGMPIYVGCSCGRIEENESDGAMGLIVSFIRDETGKIATLDRSALTFDFWNTCYILDLTGDGLIDIAVAGNPGVSGGGGVDIVTLNARGRFVQSEYIDSAYGQASVVDLNLDGLWELETSNFISYEGGNGSFQYNTLFSCNRASAGWRPITDLNHHAFRRQRWFYEDYLSGLSSYEKVGTAKFIDHVPCMPIGSSYYKIGSIGSSDIRRLLRSWDWFDVWDY